MCCLCNSKGRVVPDADSGAPLCKTSTLLVEINCSLLEVIQASAPVLTWLAAGQRNQASVHLDSWDDTVLLGQVHHELAIRRLLVQRLSEEDGTSTKLAKALGSKQQLTPTLTIWLCVLNADGFKAQATG